jgi:hypothetical protein
MDRGYARVSAREQDVTGQIAELQAAGAPRYYPRPNGREYLGHPGERERRGRRDHVHSALSELAGHQLRGHNVESDFRMGIAPRLRIDVLQGPREPTRESPRGARLIKCPGGALAWGRWAASRDKVGRNNATILTFRLRPRDADHIPSARRSFSRSPIAPRPSGHECARLLA